MPRLYGDNYSAGLNIRASINNATSRARWAMDRATGGSIGAQGAVPFPSFEAQQLPGLRAQTQAALEAMPGLSAGQKKETLALLMRTAQQAYDHACGFQAKHANSLGRRSTEYTPWLTGQMMRHHTLTAIDKVKSHLHGVPSERDFRAGVNQGLWDKSNADSPFMQAVGVQVQKMVAGLVLRVGQEASETALSRVSKQGATPPPFATLLALAKRADPKGAPFMPHVLSEGGSTVEMQLVKDHLTAAVMEKAMAPRPEKLAHDSAVLLAITNEAQQKIIDLVTSTKTTVQAHTYVTTDGAGGGHLRTDTGTDPSTHLNEGVKKIVGEMSKRIKNEIGNWIGLDKNQEMMRDLQVATGIDNIWEPVLNTSTALSTATGLLGVGLKAAALTGPVGQASNALWGTSVRVASFGLSAGIQHHAGAHVNNLPSGMRGWPNNAPPPMFDSNQKILNFETSKLLQKAAGKAGFDDLKGLVTTLQPAVTARAATNARLWADCDPEGLRKAALYVGQTAAQMPAITAMGLAACVPAVLKDASPAQLSDSVLLADLVTRLALTWDKPGHTGLESLQAGFEEMVNLMAETKGETPGLATLSAAIFDDNGPSPLEPAMMVGAKAAAAQIVAGDPASLAKMQAAMGQMLDGTAKDATEETIQRFIWGNMVGGVVNSLAMGVVGAMVGTAAAGLGAAPGAAVGVAAGFVSNLVGNKLRREQINNIHVSGFQEASRRGTTAPLTNPYKGGVTTPEEVAAQVKKMGTPLSTMYTADLQAVMSRLQQNAAVKITEKAGQAGRAMVACLLEQAGDAHGLKALHDFDVHSAKENYQGNKVRVDEGVGAKVTASRAQLQRGLSDLADDSATKRKAMGAFDQLPIVKRQVTDLDKHSAAHTKQQDLRDAALPVLLASLLAALPKNAAGVPMLDESTSKQFTAFVKYPDKGGDNATTQALTACLNQTVCVPNGTLLAHLETAGYSGASRLGAYLTQQGRDLEQLTGDLEGLHSDAQALKRGDFDDVEDRGYILKKFTNGHDGRTTVLTTHNVDNDYTTNRAVGVMIGSVALGGALGAPALTAGLAAPFMPMLGAATGVGLSSNILLGNPAVATASPMSAFSGGGNLTANTAAPSSRYKATVTEVTQDITGLALDGLSLEGTKKRRSANHDGTLPYPSSVGAGQRLGNPLKKLGFPLAAAPTIRHDTRQPALLADAAKLGSGRAYRQVFDMAKADFMSHRNMGGRALGAEVMLQAKKEAMLNA